MKALKTGQRVLGSLEQQGPLALATTHHQNLHTSRPAHGTLTIPERLQHVPGAEVRMHQSNSFTSSYNLSGSRLLWECGVFLPQSLCDCRGLSYRGDHEVSASLPWGEGEEGSWNTEDHRALCSCSGGELPCAERFWALRDDYRVQSSALASQVSHYTIPSLDTN